MENFREVSSGYDPSSSSENVKIFENNNNNIMIYYEADDDSHNQPTSNIKQIPK